ncbi:peptide ABC transporter permease [Thiocapsa imhoffii]|uniref:Peptide ABC transporter permease n=1 Tax=Thiocapsa imhoffii TaxID=382777 RepID=A0A9X0WL38_9GAMM|nr:ABC transporter permease [Thiocapsa imhoffii]MBK1646374.1 peptide ABC transporter permease [Thiocapsa imhoffii]
MPILLLAWSSLLNRRGTALLTVLSIGLSVALLVGVERLRSEIRTSFTQTLSGTDLIVGARSGPVQLLLYAVFRIGQPINNISWEAYRMIAESSRVAWTIPISLGDSHRGFPVVGTTLDYFEHYRFARDRHLTLAAGRPFADLYDAVLGAEVAAALGSQLGDKIVLAHGASDVSFARHDDHPFQVVGLLARTGTPVDRSVHVSLEGLEAIHVGWESGRPMPGRTLDPDQARTLDLTPRAITAVLVGLHSRIATFQVQRSINEYRSEPLMAILPGVALAELWGVIGVAEQALLLVSGFVVLVGLVGLLTVLLTSLNERRREMAILRSVGARPAHIFSLILGESLLLILLGILAGLALLYAGLLIAQPLILSELGILIRLGPPALTEMLLLAVVLGAGLLISLIPGYRAYRLALADGLSIRI